MVGSGGGSSSSGSGSGSGSSSSRGGRRAGRRKNALHCLVMKQKLPRLYGITVWDLWPLLSCCWGYSLGLFHQIVYIPDDNKQSSQEKND